MLWEAASHTEVLRFPSGAVKVPANTEQRGQKGFSRGCIVCIRWNSRRPFQLCTWPVAVGGIGGVTCAACPGFNKAVVHRPFKSPAVLWLQSKSIHLPREPPFCLHLPPLTSPTPPRRRHSLTRSLTYSVSHSHRRRSRKRETSTDVLIRPDLLRQGFTGQSQLRGGAIKEG